MIAPSAGFVVVTACVHRVVAREANYVQWP